MNNTRDEALRIVGELHERAAAIYGDRLRRVYLFGSYARDEADEDSDIDVALERHALGDFAGANIETRYDTFRQHRPWQSHALRADHARIGVSSNTRASWLVGFRSPRSTAVRTPRISSV